MSLLTALGHVSSGRIAQLDAAKLSDCYYYTVNNYTYCPLLSFVLTPAVLSV